MLKHENRVNILIYIDPSFEIIYLSYHNYDNKNEKVM